MALCEFHGLLNLALGVVWWPGSRGFKWVYGLLNMVFVVNVSLGLRALSGFHGLLILPLVVLW